MGELLTPPTINLPRMRRYRLQRIRQQLLQQDIAMCVLISPVSLRYAVDFREYQLFQSRIPSFYLYVSAEGPTVMHGASQQNCDLIERYLPTVGFNPFDSGFDLAESAARFAREVKAYLGELGVNEINPTIAVEYMSADVFYALDAQGINVVDASALVEQAKLIKSSDEIECMKFSIAVAEHGMAKMHSATQPGITENQLWSILTQVNTAHDGDWTDGRMLASGQRSNPWLQEASNKPIENGELVAFDTDMIGPFGYCADISRTWLCGDQAPGKRQRNAYRHAYEEIHHNLEQIQPGMSFTELVRTIYPRKQEYIAHRYPCVIHGVGMTDEYPKLYYPEDRQRQYDGIIQPDMVLCVESFSGSSNGGEGVKLEQMVRVTDVGTELLSSYPFESKLL